MQEYVIEPTNGRPNIRFQGELIAQVSSARKDKYAWTELEAYKTKAGKWVIVSIGAVSEDAPDHMETFVDVMTYDSDDTAKLTAKLGFGRLAEKLYRKMGITEVTIE